MNLALSTIPNLYPQQYLFMGLAFSGVMFLQTQVFPAYILTPEVNCPFSFCCGFSSHLVAIFHQVFIAP